MFGNPLDSELLAYENVIPVHSRGGGRRERGREGERERRRERERGREGERRERGREEGEREGGGREGRGVFEFPWETLPQTTLGS